MSMDTYGDRRRTKDPFPTPPTPDPRERGDDGPFFEDTEDAARKWLTDDRPLTAPETSRVCRALLDYSNRLRLQVLARDVDAALRAPEPSKAVRKFSAAHTRAMSDLEFTHGVGVRGDAPSEAMAEVATDGGYLRWRLNGTDPLDSIELRLPSGTWISVHGNNGVAVTVERVQAWARLLTHPAPARGVTVRFGAFNGSMTLDDSALSEATMEYGWGSSATAKELQAWREHAGRIIVAYLSALDGDAMVERGARAYNDAVFSPLLADELPLSSGEVVRRILTAAITPDAEGGA